MPGASTTILSFPQAPQTTGRLFTIPDSSTVTTPSDQKEKLRIFRRFAARASLCVPIVPNVTPSQFRYSELIRRSLSRTQAKDLQLRAPQEESRAGPFLGKEALKTYMSHLGPHGQWC